MKKKDYLWSLLVIVITLFLSSCGKDDSESDNPVKDPTPNEDTGIGNYTDDVVTGGIPGESLSFTKATIYGYINNPALSAVEKGIVYGETDNIEELKESGQKATATSFDPGTDNRRFTVNLSGLKPNTTYYYYAYAGQMTANQVLKFETKYVVLNPGKATNISIKTARLHSSTNADPSVLHGFIYSEKQDFSDSIIVWAGINDVNDNSFIVDLTSLNPGTTYYYKSCAGYEKINKVYYGSGSVTNRYVKCVSNKVMSFTTVKLCPDNNHPHAIDLGLPSGTKWACCNVEASSPSDSGGRFAWGETVSKNEFYSSEYSVPNYIEDDIAGTNYDAATANWGNLWRMPNETQYQELIQNTTKYDNYSNGVYFISNNGKGIFMPYSENVSILTTGTSYFMSNKIGSSYAYTLTISPETGYNSSVYPPSMYFYYKVEIKTQERYEGCYVRPVCN